MIQNIKIESERITPTMAEKYLATSEGNRPMNNTYIRSYADTMKRGAWMMNGVPIVFDSGGHLLDGHHRLHAVKLAGMPVWFSVARGVDSEAFTTYDCGLHRRIGQLLAMQGVKNYNLVGSIVIANDHLLKTGRLYANNTVPASNVKNTNTQFYDLYCRDPEGYERVGSRVRGLLSKSRVLTGSWAGGLYYYLTHTGGYTEQEVDAFFDTLFTLGYDSKSPAGLLRETINDEALKGRRLKAEALWTYFVKAWNAYITGQQPKTLRYIREGKMPELILR